MEKFEIIDLNKLKFGIVKAGLPTLGVCSAVIFLILLVCGTVATLGWYSLFIVMGLPFGGRYMYIQCTELKIVQKTDDCGRKIMEEYRVEKDLNWQKFVQIICLSLIVSALWALFLYALFWLSLQLSVFLFDVMGNWAFAPLITIVLVFGAIIIGYFSCNETKAHKHSTVYCR